MARRSLARLRNIGIVAHINAGKTTLTERFLFRAGKQSYMGEVDEGTATMDFMPEEQERGISISAAVANIDWRGFHLNLIDTPGHVDFTAEVERSLRVLDGVIVVIDGVAGVESQTELVWQQVQEHKVPALVFINKMDRRTADYEESLISLLDRLRCPAVPLVLPQREDGELIGLVDVVENTQIGGRDEDPKSWQPSRQVVIEACADYDEGILSDFVEGRVVEPERLHRAVRRATLHGGVVPVLTGSALLNRGVDWLLTAVCRYLPSPVDRPVIVVEGESVDVDEKAPFCGLVFKVQFDEGDCLHFVRAYSGVLRVGEKVLGSRSEEPVTVESIERLHAAHHEEVSEVVAGDVASLRVDAELVTGETLFAPGHPILLESVHFPPPVLTARIECGSAVDLPRVEAEARRLCREDPTLVLGRDQETGTPLISGMGELHLQVFEERLAAAARREVRLSPPRVRLHATVKRPAAAVGECLRHLDGEEFGAKVELAVEPAPGSGPGRVTAVEVADPVVRGLVKRLVELQLRAGMSGPEPAHDLKITVRRVTGDLDGRDAEAVLGAAVAIACRKLAAQAVVVSLEPYVDCVVNCPADCLSAALADLRARGAEIHEVLTLEGRGKVRGELPLAAVLGYATRLRSLTRGLGTVHLRPIGLRQTAGP